MAMLEKLNKKIPNGVPYQPFPIHKDVPNQPFLIPNSVLN